MKPLIILPFREQDNGKLKLETQPSHSEDIVIGKDKAAAFKRWLDR